MSTSSHLDYDYDFVPPPDAPVFTPTMEEFRDSLAYIEKIRPIGEQYGICKIKPPDEWQPPFAVDVDKLRFTPRIQRLNELEAHTRIKLNFLDQVAKFWELQGSMLKIPIVEKRALDLYTLKKFVTREGGLELVNSDGKWAKVAKEMGFNPSNSTKIGNLLKAHYERILYPLDIFEKEEGMKKMKMQSMMSPKKEGKGRMMGGGGGGGRMMGGGGGRMMGGGGGAKVCKEKEKDLSEADEDSKSFSKELARLQFHGAGSKAPGIPDGKSMKDKTRGVKLNFEYDPLAKYMCINCSKGDAEEQMLLCDGCDDSYHTFCLMPPLAEIPQGDWRCPKCILAEVSKPMEAFGFEQAQKEYTLQSFGEMADQFKTDYFNMPLHLIPMSLVEREYWRILENIDEDVMVEYGADLHSMDHGSGFPTLSSKHLNQVDLAYAESEWNLNNLPVVPNSILKHIDMDISGMKVPWLYVGMCFSTFCWHVEDHWTPSINFLHWGEPKTWYGIPSNYAEKAEAVMRDSAKELFYSQPDLLHHIVTTMNPNVLQAHGVPVYRMDQYAGEFIITFCRGYHAGFNHGYNLAEAVNFAPPDWMEIGRNCVEHYSTMRRFCVFCHDELVCKMATNPDTLTLQAAAHCYQDMLTMVDNEKKQRRALLEAGVKEAEREAFELLPEEERQCAVCKTTCFMSALTIINGKEKQEIVCLRHFPKMDVDPGSLILRYRYTLDELATLLQGLKVRAESYDSWTSQVRAALEAKGEERLEFSSLKGMLTEAQNNKYPESELLEALQLTVEEADKCQMVAQQLCSSKGKVRTRLGADAKYRLTLEELQLFSNQLETLPAKVTGHDGVAELLEKVAVFQKESSRLLEREIVDVDEVDQCLEKGEQLEIDLQELTHLKAKSDQLTWLEEVKEFLEDPSEVTVEASKSLEAAGMSLPPHVSVERGLAKLKGLRLTLEAWEEKASACMSASPKMGLLEVERLVSEGDKLSTALPVLEKLKESCRKAREWWSRAEALQKPENYPYLDTLELLVAKGRPLPVRLEPLHQLETQVAAARAWRERTARVFLKKNSHCNLLEVLSPRYEFDRDKKKKKKAADDLSVRHPIFAGLSSTQLSDPQEIVNAFKQAELSELSSMKTVRMRNEAAERDENSALLDCELCKEQFQPCSVPLPRSGSKKEKLNSLRDIKFLCPACLRSRRPRLETILSLLVSLQKLTVRLPEGEALQCLTERAMAWQDRTRTVLARPELSAALEKLSINREKEGGEAEEESSDSEAEGSPRKKAHLSDPGVVINLPAKTIQELEEVMMEGDMLEVSLDEVTHIWRILQATPERREKKYPKLEQLEAELLAAREERRKDKIKKKQQISDSSIEEREKKRLKKKKKEEARKAEQTAGDSEDDCSASPKCKRPTGKQVPWVQCDKCQLWLHLFCIGLKPSDIKEDEDFNCRNCKAGRRKETSGSDMDTE